VNVQPPPVTVTVFVELLVVRVAVTAFGLVDEELAGIMMLDGVAELMPRLNELVVLYVTGFPDPSTVSR
jgi:hypothetical protein